MRAMKGRSGSGAMFNMQPEGLTGIILPADDVLKAVRQVPAPGEEKDSSKAAEPGAKENSTPSQPAGKS